jgi:hypothetical protein
MTTWPDGYLFGRGPERVFAPTTLTDRADRVWKVAGLNRITLQKHGTPTPR